MKAAALLAILLVAPLAGAAVGDDGAWSQWGGDAGHSGRAALGELDVLQAFPLTDGLSLETTGGPGLVSLGDQVLGLARSGAECFLVAGVPPARLAKASPAIACPLGGRLAAWDAANARALVCIDGASTDPLLQAWPLGATQPSWTHAPGQAAPDPAALGASQGNANGAWSCRGLALDGDRAYAPFSSTIGRNRIEAIRLADGQAVWGTSVPADLAPGQTPAGPLPGLPGVVADTVGEGTGAFRIGAAAATPTGILVTGRLDGNPLTQAPPGLAWFSRDGTLQGTYTLAPSPVNAATSPATQATLFPASQHPAASGNLAASLVGDGLFVVDPANPQGRSTPIAGAVLSRPDVPGPCWGRDALFVPGETLGFILPASDLGTVARWPGFGLGRLQGCIITGGTAWVAITRTDNGTHTDLLAVDLARSASLQRIPLPLHPKDAGALGVHLTPLAHGRLLAWDDGGEAVMLGATSAALPHLVAETLYPGAQAAAILQVAPGADAPAGTRLLLAWGDGALEEATPGSASRTYGAGGERTVRLTSVQPDGTTATARLVLHVGQTEPVEPGLVAVLFSPEYQNYTFFTIGVLITLVTSALAAAGVSKGRKRIDRRLREMDAIQEAGRRDPFAAVRDLHAYRLARRLDLAHGHLDDTQYTVLESHADKVLQVLRQRILGGFVGRVSEPFSHALDTALADGAFDESEASQLLARVGDEQQLDAGEKERLRSLVASWRADPVPNVLRRGSTGGR
ncbi:MAG TPA: hypothetical protein VM286_05775 [Candidatus Thermoplasmatota archaeon]|nr:hypothetical protein [Candidatus Thermoplasmatota archaeon]